MKCFVYLFNFLRILKYFTSQGSELCKRHIDSTCKEVMHNPKYEELFAPDLGPENPFRTQQQRAAKNMLSGYVEAAHISEFQFENQRRTFTSYGNFFFFSQTILKNPVKQLA